MFAGQFLAGRQVRAQRRRGGEVRFLGLEVHQDVPHPQGDDSRPFLDSRSPFFVGSTHSLTYTYM
jgi:hypothetical protein